MIEIRREQEGRREWEIEDLWEEVNAEREEEQEIDGIEAKGEMHRAGVSAIREKTIEIPYREREIKISYYWIRDERK